MASGVALQAQAYPTPAHSGDTLNWNTLNAPMGTGPFESIYLKYMIRLEGDYKPVRWVTSVVKGSALVPISIVQKETAMTYQQVLSEGVSPDLLIDPTDWDPEISNVTYKKFNFINLDFAYRGQVFEKNALGNQTVSVQGDGSSARAEVRMMNPLGDERYFEFPLPPSGAATVTINSVHAGVWTYEAKLVTPSGLEKVYKVQRTIPKGTTTAVALNLAGPLGAASRARIDRTALVQAVQNDQGTAYVIAGNPARFRVWLVDAVAADPLGVTCTVTANVPGLGVKTVASGVAALGQNFKGDALDFPVPGPWVRPGTSFSVTVNIPGKGSLTSTVSPNIVAGEEIELNVFEVRPYPGASGVPAARSEAALRSQVVQYSEAMIPVRKVNICIRPLVSG